MKAQIKKLRTENIEKDRQIIQFKKRVNFDKEKKQLIDRILQLEEEVSKSYQDRDDFKFNQSQYKDTKYQKEFEDIIKQNNMLKEKDQQLQQEISELRGALNSQEKIKTLE